MQYTVSLICTKEVDGKEETVISGVFNIDNAETNQDLYSEICFVLQNFSLSDIFDKTQKRLYDLLIETGKYEEATELFCSNSCDVHDIIIRPIEFLNAKSPLYCCAKCSFLTHNANSYCGCTGEPTSTNTTILKQVR